MKKALAALAIVTGTAAAAAVPLNLPGPFVALSRTQADHDVRTIFAAFDADRDGYVTRQEARAARWQDADLARRISRMLDSDRDARVSLSEAVTIAMAAFDSADTNGDGIMTPKERQTARVLWR